MTGEEYSELFTSSQLILSSPPRHLVQRLAAQVDFLGESTEGNLHLVSAAATPGIVNVLGLNEPCDILSVPFADLKRSQEVSYCRTMNEIIQVKS